MAELAPGADFEFELDKDKAYGDREASRILDLDREMFCINGHFDHENIFVDAIVPLQNEDGNRFYGRVLEITDDKIIIPDVHGDARGWFVEQYNAARYKAAGITADFV